MFIKLTKNNDNGRTDKDINFFNNTLFVNKCGNTKLASETISESVNSAPFSNLI